MDERYFLTMRIFVPSLDRPQNVAPMEALAGNDGELWWIVSPQQCNDYVQAGAKQVIVSMQTAKSPKLNEVLDECNDEWCVFSDDDCQNMVRLDRRNRLQKISLSDAADEMVEVGERRGDHLVCLSGSTNSSYLNHRVTRWGMTVGWFFAIAPDTPCRFDEKLVMHEDSDFAAQVYDRYGRIARINWIMGRYRMGGRDSHYSYASLDDTMGAVVKKWPGLFTLKPGPKLSCRKTWE